MVDHLAISAHRRLIPNLQYCTVVANQRAWSGNGRRATVAADPSSEVGNRDAVVGPWELVESLFDASISPERLAELINVWDAQMAAADLQARSVNLGSAFAHQVAAVFQILEQLQATELQRVNDLVSEIHSAAMVLSDDGRVIAANRAAYLSFGLVGTV